MILYYYETLPKLVLMVLNQSHTQIYHLLLSKWCEMLIIVCLFILCPDWLVQWERGRDIPILWIRWHIGLHCDQHATYVWWSLQAFCNPPAVHWYTWPNWWMCGSPFPENQGSECSITFSSKLLLCMLPSQHVQLCTLEGLNTVSCSWAMWDGNCDSAACSNSCCSSLSRSVQQINHLPTLRNSCICWGYEFCYHSTCQTLWLYTWVHECTHSMTIL